MKIKQTLLALGIAALSMSAFAQATQAEREHQERLERERNHRGPPAVHIQVQPHVPPHVQQHNDRDGRFRHDDRDHRRDRDFRNGRDHKHWNDRDHRRNYETLRAHVHELRIGMRKREVLDLPWWKHPMYVEDNGPFDTYVYADGRYRRCVLNFRFNRLAEIECN